MTSSLLELLQSSYQKNADLMCGNQEDCIKRYNWTELLQLLKNKGPTINHLGGAWCKTKKKISFGGSPKKKNPSKGPPKKKNSVNGASEKKKLRSVNLTVKKKFFLRFSCKTMLLKKKNSSVNFGKKIKISFGGSPKKKNFVRENPHHAPPR